MEFPRTRLKLGRQFNKGVVVRSLDLAEHKAKLINSFNVADRLREERKEGYVEEEETPAMREMEAGLIADAAEEKARAAKRGR